MRLQSIFILQMGVWISHAHIFSIRHINSPLLIRPAGEEAASVGLQNLEVMCNPNAYATAFDAKVLITVSTTAGVKVTTEGRLSNLKQDVDAFLEA